MAKSVHSRYVARRFNIARQQLAMARSGELSVVQVDGALENALTQLYYALLHYVNELQEAYALPLLTSNDLGVLEAALKQKNNSGAAGNSSELSELNVLQQQNNWLSRLMRHPMLMLTRANIPEHEQEESHQQAVDVANVADSVSNASTQLIHLVVDRSDDIELMGDELSCELVDIVLSEFQKLVQRQREHLIEC